VFPRVSGFTMPRWTFFRHDIATPTLAFVPILVLPLLNVQPTMSTVLALQATVVALVMVAAAAMAFASLRRLRALI
jgi:hypothetical protein